MRAGRGVVAWEEIAGPSTGMQQRVGEKSETNHSANVSLI